MLGLPKLYNDNTINNLLTGSGASFKHWNQGYSVERSQALPRTDIGLTWSRNADGTIHVEGTLEDGKANANWRMLKPEVNNGFLCPNHKYYIHVPDLDSRFYVTPNSLTRTTTIIPEGYIVHVTAINNNNLNSAGFYYRYTPTQESRTVNVDLPAPYIVDLTDMYGIGNEPGPNSPIYAKLKKYCEKHTDFVSSPWILGSTRWTWQKWFNANGTATSPDKRMVYRENPVACNGGDTITVQLTTQPEVTLGLLYEWASDGTFVKRTVLMGGSGTVSWTATAEANTAYVTLTLYNNANLEMTPAALTAANVSITAESPAPSHYCDFLYPFSFTGSGLSVTITEPGTYTLAEGLTLSIDNNNDCTFTFTSTDLTELMLSIDTFMPDTHFENGKYNIPINLNGNVVCAAMFVSCSIPMVRNGSGVTETKNFDYQYMQDDETEELVLTQNPLDLTDLSTGEYYNIDPYSTRRIIFLAYNVKTEDGQLVIVNPCTITFHLGFDKVE